MFDKRIDLVNFVFEITRECNHDCLYCYNVWKIPGYGYPNHKEMSLEQIKLVISKLIKETRIKYLAISGGEPLLKDITPDVIRFSTSNKIQANLLSNGSLFTEDKVDTCMEAGTAIFEVPFLTLDRKLHQELTGRNDLDQVIEGIKLLKKKKALLVVVFVATRLNIESIKETLEMAIALDVDGIMFNRFNPGGNGLNHNSRLMPSLQQIKESLSVLNKLSGYYGVNSSASVPVQKCLINQKEYRHVRFGHCPSGDKKSYFTIDASGNVRICNHSQVILGNLLEQDFADIYRHPFIDEFRQAAPSNCSSCRQLKSCWGGCKASAHICSGHLTAPDPLLSKHMDEVL